MSEGLKLSEGSVCVGTKRKDAAILGTQVSVLSLFVFFLFVCLFVCLFFFLLFFVCFFLFFSFFFFFFLLLIPRHYHTAAGRTIFSAIFLDFVSGGFCFRRIFFGGDFSDSRRTLPRKIKSVIFRSFFTLLTEEYNYCR